ncbi:hypothetical protein C8J56DRAFT_829377 [Mycena floridula]|nr:hypothetical protein C8J56DRAFT_829377 [Mycena floridula]
MDQISANSEELELEALLSPTIDDGAIKKNQGNIRAKVHDRSYLFITGTTMLFCLICTLINVTYLGRSLFKGSPLFLHNSLEGIDVASLRRPSQFIGLAPYLNFSPTSFLSYPLVLSPVDETRPSVVLNNDPKRHLSSIGTISPEDRQLRVSRTISTVMQFRAMDFGMEICELQMMMPNASTNSLQYLVLPSVQLELFQLKSLPRRLQEHSLSYSTRPVREKSLGRIEFQAGMSWKYQFPCAMDELFTFELACPSDRKAAMEDTCRLEWWQNQEHSSPAVSMVQHSSV